MAASTRQDRAGRILHLIGAIAMILGMFLPLTDAGRALAAPGPASDPAPALAQADEVATTSFTQVTAIGDFQSQFGCTNNDAFCQGTVLTNHDGIWTGTLLMAPGDYSWQIAAVTQDGQQYVFGDNGLNGDPQQVTVADTDAGIYFRFNAASQTVDAVPVDGLYTLATDTGNYALEPAQDTLSAIVQSPGGPLNVELQIGGAPVGNPQTATLEPGPNEITVDRDG
ncbi:MAG TPA: hypothetical protein VM450_19920, partial [Thermomicrobiales bacterium]|nr:hypothetical protein [Thermomicrobiales bacterium]